jgi:beta-glucosidase
LNLPHLNAYGFTRAIFQFERIKTCHLAGSWIKNGSLPRGFGLSYTTFSFSHLKIKPTNWNGTGDVTVSFTVTNTGNRAGAEVAQLYVGQENPPISRPIKELKGFAKVSLKPHQSETVTLTLNQRSFAYFNTDIHKWDALPGKYQILVGSSSQSSDLSLKGSVDLRSELTANP